MPKHYNITKPHKLQKPPKMGQFIQVLEHNLSDRFIANHGCEYTMYGRVHDSLLVHHKDLFGIYKHKDDIFVQYERKANNVVGFDYARVLRYKTIPKYAVAGFIARQEALVLEADKRFGQPHYGHAS